MNEFIKYLKRENFIQKLLEYYKVNHIKTILEEYFNKFIEKFKEIEVKIGSKNENGLLNLDFNSLGKFYEESLPLKERKLLGEFYTPQSIVNYILDAVGYKESNNIQYKKLIDISCGTGSFIILAIRVLVSSCLKNYNRNDCSELLPDEARKIVLRIKENIYGIDINPLACILCQINIHFELFELMKIITDKDRDYNLPIFRIVNSNSLILNETEQYDYVVGNPPYLFIRDIPNEQKQIIENGNFKTKDGQYDYYQIFIELGVRLLRSKGILGYIVPDSLLVLSNRSILRKYIYDTTNIREIYNIGPQFEDPVVANIIIVLEKEFNLQEREKNYIKVKLPKEKTKEISQQTLKEWNYKFLIHLSELDRQIINHLDHKFPKLKDLIKKEDFKILLSRGIELTKKGKIISCNNCRKYFPIPKKVLVCPECKKPLDEKDIEKIIFESVQKEEKNKFKLFVNSINRYEIKDYRFIRMDKKGINYKDFEIYKDHIIIRQLSQNKLICATYVKDLSLTSQSFYNLRIYHSSIEEFNNIYLLGIINSKLLSYYFIKLFGSYKKLFPRILIEKIKEFPIKIPEDNKEKEIALKIHREVKNLLNLNETEVGKSNSIQEKIDNLIFRLYRIPDLYQAHILKFLRKCN